MVVDDEFIMKIITLYLDSSSQGVEERVLSTLLNEMDGATSFEHHDRLFFINLKVCLVAKFF